MDVFTIIIIVITSLLMAYSVGAFFYGLIKKRIIKRRIEKEAEQNGKK